MNRIKEVLENKGIKQTWLAEQLNKSYNMVNSYVQNRRQPNLEDLYRIADILAVDVRELLLSSLIGQTNSEPETVNVPLLGTVACGVPILAEANIKAMIPVSTKLLRRNHRYFLLRASGNSMDNYGIKDGDLVLIKQQSSAENGEIVVALIDDEATIKEFQRQEDVIVLKPKSKNKKYQPIILTSDFKIQGVVERVITI